MRAALELCIIRIYSNTGKVIGAGCLVSQKHILTCAHVVADALGLPRNTVEMPDALITLDFPLLAAKQLLKAKVVFWRPVNPDVEAEDIAGLELENSLPQMAQPAKFITSDDLWAHPFRVLGFPSGQPNGVSATGVLRERIANAWIQLEDIKEPGYRLEAGFSGAPIWNEELQGIAGMAVAAEMKRPETKAAFMIPASVLNKAWNEVNVVSQELIEELEAKLIEYFPRARKLIFASYSRSGHIDQDCKKWLEKARNDIGLFSSDTASYEDELLWLCQSMSKKVQESVKQSEQDVINLFVENSFENDLEFEQSRMNNMLEQLKVALGLNAENATETLSLSISNYGKKLLRLDNTKAVLVFQRALNYNSKNIEAHIGLGSAFLQNSQFLKAIKAFQKANEIGKKKSFSREDIKNINSLIKKAKIMLWQQNVVKILRLFSLIPITRIMRIISRLLVRFITFLGNSKK